MDSGVLQPRATEAFSRRTDLCLDFRVLASKCLMIWYGSPEDTELSEKETDQVLLGKEETPEWRSQMLSMELTLGQDDTFSLPWARV